MAARKRTETAVVDGEQQEPKLAVVPDDAAKDGIESVEAAKPKRAPRKKAEPAPTEKTSRARLDRKTIDLIVKLRDDGLGVVKIARELEKRGIKTATGKDAWHGPNIRQVLARELGDEAWAASVASVKAVKQTDDVNSKTDGK